MQNGEFAQRFIQMLRPENVGNAAQTAITWLKLPPAPIGIKPIRLANFPATLGRLGALEVRLARNAAEIRRAQKLRYRVFYREMSAVPDATSCRKTTSPFHSLTRIV